MPLNESPLGKKSAYVQTYEPSILFPIPRKHKREEIGIIGDLPFTGEDIWNGFELSWLNLKGKPIVALAEFRIPCESPHLIESKSFKLYLNSFNHSRFESFSQVAALLEKDLSEYSGATVGVQLKPLREPPWQLGSLEGNLLDALDIECSQYLPDAGFLSVGNEYTEEVLCTDLLKSNCLVTGQPDWGSLQVEYSGKKIDPEGLLRYIVSFRDHPEFHEQCVERIFLDIQKRCQPQWLTLYARYTRRGGLDINPFRTNRNLDCKIKNMRLIRQ